jgi:hypothetical protein
MAETDRKDRMTTYEVLKKALALIEDEKDWCQGKTGWGRRCAVGAISTTVGGIGSHTDDVLNYPPLKALCVALGGNGIVYFNDTHTHAEVVALFRTAIRAEKAKAGIPIEVPIEDPVRA